MVAIEIAEFEGSGRGLVAVTPIAAGELVLRESPVLLTVTQSLHRSVCAQCLRYISAGTGVQCDGCAQASFCNKLCQETAARQGHSAAVCGSMAQAGLDDLLPETADQARFIIQAQGLIDPAIKGGAMWKKKALAKLQSADGAHADSAGLLEWAEKYFGPEKWQKWKAAVMTLASQDRINSYGIMAPPGPNGERRIRGSAVYPMGSLLNHDCMPNVARFDDFDAAHEENAFVEFRALHDIPADTQITQSYFPLSWNFEERQQRCIQQYGFTCICDRCQVEQHWVQESSDGESIDGAVEAKFQMPECKHDPNETKKHRPHGETETKLVTKHKQEAQAGCEGQQDGQHDRQSQGEQGTPERQQEANEGEQGHQEGDEGQADSKTYNGVDEAYVMAYLGRHVCPQELPLANKGQNTACEGQESIAEGEELVSEGETACGGTMAPVGIHGDLYTCNMCNCERLESDRVAELERVFQAVAQEAEQQVQCP